MIDAWTTFFHAPDGPESVGLFRIGVGLLLVIDALSYFRQARYFLNPTGLYDHHLFARKSNRLSLFRYLPASTGTATAVVFAYLVSAAFLMVGLYTAFAAAACLVFLHSIQGRCGPTLHSGDTLLRLMLFLIIFSEAGSVFTLGSGAAVTGSAEAESPWAHRLMQVQFAAVYLHTVRWKLQGTRWRNGTAVYYATQLLTHQRHQIPRLLQRPWVYRMATYGTLAVEASLGVLIWFDALVYGVIAIGVLFHLSLEYFMRMHLFQWTMIVSMILFIPPEDISAMVAGLMTLFGG